MNAERINPFIESTVSVLEMMVGCTVTRTGLAMHDSFTPEFDVTGVIGLSGKATGDVVISFDRGLALAATEALVGASCDEIDSDVIDTIGELTNMIAGSAKAHLEELELTLALPTVIVGKDHSIRFPSNIRPIAVPFDSDMGKLSIEVGFVDEE